MLKKDGAGGISVLGSVIEKARISAAKNKKLWLAVALVLVTVAVVALVVVL